MSNRSEISSTSIRMCEAKEPDRMNEWTDRRALENALTDAEWDMLDSGLGVREQVNKKRH